MHNIEESIVKKKGRKKENYQSRKVPEKEKRERLSYFVLVDLF